MNRRIRPQRRKALTFDLVFKNQIITISAGYFSNGDLGEIFIGTGKVGTDLSTLARDIAITLSLALQHGVTIGVIQHAVLRDARGGPLSLIGTVVDELAQVRP